VLFTSTMRGLDGVVAVARSSEDSDPSTVRLISDPGRPAPAWRDQALALRAHPRGHDPVLAQGGAPPLPNGSHAHGQAVASARENCAHVENADAKRADARTA
jgi:hypothetical protein